jgi:sulfate adenylyltransferase subunit 2
LTKSIPILNRLRREAVRLRGEGMAIKAVSRFTGLSAPTVIQAHKAFLAGGWDAVDVQPRGRAPGEGRRLDDAREAELFRLLSGNGPDALDLPCRLWDIEAVQALAGARLAIELPKRTVASYLQRWGLSMPRPSRRIADGSELLRHWHATAYPAILARAQREKACVYWIDESSLVWPGTADRGNVIRAVTQRGHMQWLAYAGALRAPVLIDFFDRLLAGRTGKALVIVDSMGWQRAAPLMSWLQARGDRLLVFHTPDEKARPAAPATQATTAPRTDPRRPINSLRPPAGNDWFALQIKLLAAQSDKPRSSYTGATAIRRGTELMSLTHLQRLEAESIHILREVVAEAENPVMLYSIGKDSAVMLHLAMKAFYPGKPPFPLLHVDTTWKFREMYEFRDRTAKELGMDLLVHVNPDGLTRNINPFTHGSAIHTDVMKTEGLKQALDKYGFDAAFGGARRDEEKSRAKERVFSFRSSQHRWDPKNQRPELWHTYNTRKHKGESLRVFPLSNWTEFDVWQYIYLQRIPIVPLYFAKERPVVERDGALIMVDDERMPLRDGEVPVLRKVRFRTLGCYPLTGAIESDADSLPMILEEMLASNTSERQGRVIDRDSIGSMEKKKQEGYF